MNSPKSPSRRAVLSASMLLPLVAWAPSVLATSETTPRRAGETLVAYFSRTGNTRVIAGQIHRARTTDLFEIKPATSYPEDYEQTVAQARRERDSGFEPALQDRVSNMANYSTVFLGFPIWGGTAPPIIRSFLSSHDLSGKTLIPFITHGGYGLGNSLAVIAEHAPRARLLKTELSMEADQERRTLNRVTDWLNEVPSTD
ncbi:Flavodoxin [Franzmannia pantelleriensis]|uniref:Flavodoxin n=1 Tax=Franzmannia pantelleriensis TaxID=48727 RepID=A0A1G9R7A8_9GAMM|nr:flavodoxin [Halomonas pantelleriensis]SDM19010.1 Flavodoxin [Halomonas pantelleriensis]